ncbi:hypothetical protein CN378_18465 [Bacillus sp. AFS015802]|nr:hypothetical protein CN378_18465 [Bacillus sp. AFS015802]
MQTVVNLYCMKVNSVSGNGSITIGEAVHNSHTSNNKSQGINSSYGDTSPTESMMENVYIDPDVNDQSDLGNADSVNAGAPVPVPVPVDPREAGKEDPHAVSDQHI